MAFALAPDKPASQNQRDLKELQIARTALVKDRTRLKNRLQTLTLAFAIKQAKARLTLVSRQLRDIEAEINACITQDDATAHKRQILRSIPGIGSVTAAAILIECPEIGTLTGRADRQPVRPCTHDAPVRKMDRPRLYPGWAQAPA